MASILKHGKKWRALVARGGVRKSKVFRTKQEARDWAAGEEASLKDGPSAVCQLPFGDVMKRYGTEVSPQKRGHRWEVMRIEKFRADSIGKVRMCDLGPVELAEWRDRRLREVSTATVRRERNLMSAILTQARREWRYIEVNPMADVAAPKEPPPRTRLVTPEELEQLAIAAGDNLKTKRARAFHAFRFALETGMRAGEILGLSADVLDLDQRVAHLSRTKNGDNRDVPLSSEAVRLLEALPDQDRLFAMSSADLDAAWRNIRDRAGVEGLTFHDSRHSAVTHLSKKLDVLALARMIGHRDIKQLMVYYNAPASDLAKLLD